MYYIKFLKHAATSHGFMQPGQTLCMDEPTEASKNWIRYGIGEEAPPPMDKLLKSPETQDDKLNVDPPKVEEPKKEEKKSKK